MAIQWLQFVNRSGMEKVRAPNGLDPLLQVFREARERERQMRLAHLKTALTAVGAFALTVPLYWLGGPLWGKILLRTGAVAWQAVWGLVAQMAARDALIPPTPPVDPFVKQATRYGMQIAQVRLYQTIQKTASYPQMFVWIQAHPASDYNGALYEPRLVQTICDLAEENRLALVHREVASRAAFQKALSELSALHKSCGSLLVTGHGNAQGVTLQVKGTAPEVLQPADFEPLCTLPCVGAPDLFLYSCSTGTPSEGSYAHRVWNVVGRAFGVIALTKACTTFAYEGARVKRNLSDLLYLEKRKPPPPPPRKPTPPSPPPKPTPTSPPPKPLPVLSLRPPAVGRVRAFFRWLCGQ